MHSNSDDSLFDDLKHVVSAPRQLLSHLVGSRTKEDREELKRILTHLPAIRECRTNRAFKKADTSAVAAPAEKSQLLSVPDAVLALKAATPRASTAPNSGTTPRGSRHDGQAATPRSAAAALAAASAPLSARAAKPQAAATPRRTPPGAANLGAVTGAAYPVAVTGASPVPPATPRGSRGNTPRLGSAGYVALKVASPSPNQVPVRPKTTPPGVGRSPPQSLVKEDQPSAPSSAATKAAIATKKAIELRGDKAARKPEDEKKSQAEATQRVIEKLAELGIDPEGMSATDILRIFYARGSGSSYWLANREAEKRLNIRASTPKSFDCVLKPRAEREIRRARDLPVTNVHEYLDQWEIAFLGDICRSLRCFDEAAEGNCSEYMNKYTLRQYGAQSGRKKFTRPTT